MAETNCLATVLLNLFIIISLDYTVRQTKQPQTAHPSCNVCKREFRINPLKRFRLTDVSDDRYSDNLRSPVSHTN